jgi:seryl-tRNA(Sec) selenium transferase
MPGAEWGDIYQELGAEPVINAIGSVTMLGGSTPAPEVKEAMERADRAYIPLTELEEGWRRHRPDDECASCMYHLRSWLGPDAGYRCFHGWRR